MCGYEVSTAKKIFSCGTFENLHSQKHLWLWKFENLHSQNIFWLWKPELPEWLWNWYGLGVGLCKIIRNVGI